MQNRNLNQTTVYVNRYQPGNPVACGRWSFILALPFILVTAKSPDQKQEVSNQIKNQNLFVAAGGSSECRRELPVSGIKEGFCGRRAEGAQAAGAANMAPNGFGLSFGGLAFWC